MSNNSKSKPIPSRCSPFDLTGKSVSRVACEANALGLTYGQYETACKNGTINLLLKDKHIINGKKLVENAWNNRKQVVRSENLEDLVY